MLKRFRKWLEDEHDRTIARQEKAIDTLVEERDSLREHISKLRGHVADLEQKKAAEEREMKHLLKMDRERVVLEQERFEAKCERERDEAIGAVKDEYRDKTELMLREEKQELKAMYSEVLARLPNISARLSVKEQG